MTSKRSRWAISCVFVPFLCLVHERAIPAFCAAVLEQFDLLKPVEVALRLPNGYAADAVLKQRLEPGKQDVDHVDVVARGTLVGNFL